MDRLLAELEAVPPDDGLSYALDDLAERWRAQGIGLEGVEAALAYIERHPALDHGAPGPLVHFAELFHGRGYEAALLRSFERRPTPLTVWMLTRLVNGTQDAATREAYVVALERAESDPATDPDTRSEITRYLSRGA